MLEPVSARFILVRMLNNLKNAHVHQGHFDGALSAVERLIDLRPDEPVHLRDLGLLHYQLSNYGLALRHLQRYAAADNISAEDPIREVIVNCQTALAHLN
jgi:regulator of sirC expression with transglutaminase-like and TPR domain